MRKEEPGEKGRCVGRKRRNRGGKMGGKRNKVRKGRCVGKEKKK